MKPVTSKILECLSALAITGALIWTVELSASHGQQGRPQAGDFYQWLSNSGRVGFSPNGAVYLPQNVYSGFTRGRVSPIMQFAITNHMMTSCIQDLLKRPPTRRSAYVRSKATFDSAVCRVTKCFQQALMLTFLSSLSENQRVGGSTDPQERGTSRSQALSFLTAFQKDEGCNAGGGGDALDPMLLQLLQKNQ